MMNGRSSLKPFGSKLQRNKTIILGKINSDETNKFAKKLVAFSTNHMYIFGPTTSNSCTICPPDNFCPEGPKLEYKVKYDKIQVCMNYRHMRRLGFVFSWKKKSCFDRVLGLFRENKEKTVKMVFGIREIMVKEAICNIVKRQDIRTINDYSAELDIADHFQNKMVRRIKLF